MLKTRPFSAKVSEDMRKAFASIFEAEVYIEPVGDGMVVFVLDFGTREAEAECVNRMASSLHLWRSLFPDILSSPNFELNDKGLRDVGFPGTTPDHAG